MTNAAYPNSIAAPPVIVPRFVGALGADCELFASELLRIRKTGALASLAFNRAPQKAPGRGTSSQGLGSLPIGKAV
jgi:hypothetical protein